MKIKEYALTLREKLSEFDLWVTPSLGEIRDTEQFKANLEYLKNGFDILGILSNNYSTCEECSASSLAQNVITYINNKESEVAADILNSICNVLLLATGKTDNNLKCQYPLFLKNKLNIQTYPHVNSNGRTTHKAIPRTLGMQDVNKLIVQLKQHIDYQEKFISSYFHLILSDKAYANQLWSLGTAYSSLKKSGDEDSLISSIVVFQSRGSITATQGHIPEHKLRLLLTDWGLQAGYDYNTQDVALGDFLEGIEVDDSIKKRKYDFIIPFQSRKEGKKLFIQSQFYAGDSGSVSHKVVDQTDSTRTVTLKKYPQAVFVEYLDGAGYYSSLNGDLRKMLAKETTKDFFQIRTAPIKLRRELQGIRFLTALEIEHAILKTAGESLEVYKLLEADGYSLEEIKQELEEALKYSIIAENESGKYSLQKERIPIIRRYCLLDILANYGEPIPSDKSNGYLIVPGYEVFYGLPQNRLIEITIKEVPAIEMLWGNKVDPFDDIQWMLDMGFIIAK